MEKQQQFDKDGYLLISGLLATEEITALAHFVQADLQVAGETYGKRDAAGRETKLAVRNQLDNSPYSAIVRSERVAATMTLLLGDEVYHYHHKLMVKEPRVGGAWEWHQDYGYWYNNGCLFPDMASCLIAISPSSRKNGCLQVIRGSHKLGRVDHVTVGDQFQADPQRVGEALKRMDLEYCEMQPGDALFFHANLLHRSDANTSEEPRLSMICCYNTRHNDPFVKNGRHPNYSPLDIWSDERVNEVLMQSVKH
jgi:ectoine hydroxylase-related dioxygenase (phytanoyl-CoA dioxygenase family)